MSYRTKGIILKTVDIGETDVLITIFSEDFGKLILRAQGIRKREAKLRGHIQPLTLSDISFVSTRSQSNGGFRLIGAESLNDFFSMKRRFASIFLSRAVLQVVDRLLEERVKDTFLFSLLTTYAQAMDRDSEEAKKITFLFLWKLALHLGYQPSGETCARCGGQEQVGYLSGSAGGAVCEKCSWSFQDAFLFPFTQAQDKGAGDFREFIHTVSLSPAHCDEALRSVFHFLTWQCGAPLPAFSFLLDSATMKA